MMRKIILILSILLLQAGAFASTPGKTVSKARITSVISECRRCEGAEVVRMGRIATALFKKAIRIAADDDPDAREVLSLMKGVRGISVLDYEDCSEKDRAMIVGKLERALSGSEILMEAKDEGEVMRIYGVIDEGSDNVRDFVVHVPSDCSLICIFGSISIDKVARLVSK